MSLAPAPPSAAAWRLAPGSLSRMHLRGGRVDETLYDEGAVLCVLIRHDGLLQRAARLSAVVSAAFGARPQGRSDLDPLHVLLHAIEPLVPEPAVALDPGIDTHQRLRLEAGRPKPGFAASGDESGALEHFQVLRDGRNSPSQHEANSERLGPSGDGRGRTDQRGAGGDPAGGLTLLARKVRRTERNVQSHRRKTCRDLPERLRIRVCQCRSTERGTDERGSEGSCCAIHQNAPSPALQGHRLVAARAGNTQDRPLIGPTDVNPGMQHCR